MSATLPSGIAARHTAHAFVLVLLVTLVVAAWVWLLPMHMAPMSILRVGVPVEPVSWTVATAMFVFVMWAVMMVAMMIPSALPMVLVHERVARRQAYGHHPLAATMAFGVAYVVVWTGFSTFATATQWLLGREHLMTGTMSIASALLSGALLIAAGLFQWTPVKHACLSKCRSPVTFILNEWRPSVSGAFVSGLRHGVFCIGCCWALMMLLFVFGTMNVVAAVALAMLVLAEKSLPRGDWVARGAGVLLVVWGAWIIATAAG